MTIVPSAPGEPRRPDGPRNSGDAWVVAESGEKYWGRYGAAGVLAVDADRGVLLQLRVGWSHFGGTWGVPGGALHEGETALDGAVREAQEEAGIPDGALRPRFVRVVDLDIWSYTTVVADVAVAFEPVISDPESVALEWVPIDEVDQRPLHPGFAAAWPVLRELLTVRPVIVVDAANVIGSVPDGWWEDRAGAAKRLRDRLATVEIPAESLDLPSGSAAAGERSPASVTQWSPEIVLVVEGKARSLPDAPSTVTVVRASDHGDDTIVDEARRRVDAGATVTVVTSDRELRERAERLGARTQPAGWLTRGC
ncbi:NUDIX domain-containing protein [Microbacterium esteraromaticum]|uniref:NUDIX domain-containing protein n=1 Tax=Microbacterium esteraromaticum TaxID=57043 RepID=UPI000B354915|nr:NUDIX domain-containing protein [Microbacterium esteraromaticum]